MSVRYRQQLQHGCFRLWGRNRNNFSSIAHDVRTVCHGRPGERSSLSRSPQRRHCSGTLELGFFGRRRHSDPLCTAMNVRVTLGVSRPYRCRRIHVPRRWMLTTTPLHPTARVSTDAFPGLSSCSEQTVSPPRLSCVCPKPYLYLTCGTHSHE